MNMTGHITLEKRSPETLGSSLSLRLTLGKIVGTRQMKSPLSTATPHNSFKVVGFLRKMRSLWKNKKHWRQRSVGDDSQSFHRKIISMKEFPGVILTKASSLGSSARNFNSFYLFVCLFIYLLIHLFIQAGLFLLLILFLLPVQRLFFDCLKYLNADWI